MGCHFLLHGIFPTQRSNPRLKLRSPSLRPDAYHLSHQGSSNYWTSILLLVLWMVYPGNPRPLPISQLTMEYITSFYLSVWTSCMLGSYIYKINFYFTLLTCLTFILRSAEETRRAEENFFLHESFQLVTWKAESWPLKVVCILISKACKYVAWERRVKVTGCINFHQLTWR